eukprot:11038287-Alexandrium_andersonii.AAC.1
MIGRPCSLFGQALQNGGPCCGAAVSFAWICDLLESPKQFQQTLAQGITSHTTASQPKLSAKPKLRAKPSPTPHDPTAHPYIEQLDGRLLIRIPPRPLGRSARARGRRCHFGQQGGLLASLLLALSLIHI